MWERYFDNAATTPVDPQVVAAMLPFLTEHIGNAHSLHALGRRAMHAVENARIQVAQALGAEDPAQIVFTSGATEGNNWVLSRFNSGWVSPFEHSSVDEPSKPLGFGRLPHQGVRLLRPASPRPFVSVMAVNNEIGTCFDLGDTRTWGGFVHSDLTQAVGKVPVDLSPLDAATFSAHKFYGPKGVGAVFLKDPSLSPLLLGGEQENGLRAGTLNVPGIVGMGEAIRIAELGRVDAFNQAALLRETVLHQLEKLSDWQINGGDTYSPYILSLSFLAVEGESLVIELDAAGYCISSGAACSSRSTEPSHVLVALGLEEAWRRGTVRISFGQFNTVEAAEGLGRALARTVSSLRKL